MKVNKHLLLISFFIGFTVANAQEKSTNLSLSEAVALALKNSTEIHLATAKTETKKLEWQSSKDNRYPNFELSGQYMRVTQPTIESKIQLPISNNSPLSKIDQFIIGQAKATLPIFAGFKIQNNITALENIYQAEVSKAAHSKEEIALYVIENYTNLYRAQKATLLIAENLKTIQQRVNDFTVMEQNGLIARNDLLKVQLQESKIQLALDEANKNVSIINYQLLTFLKLPEEYKITINEKEFDTPDFLNNANQNAVEDRQDLQALQYLVKASDNQIKIAKANYFPSVALVAGITFLDIKDILTVKKAPNFGIGVTYDVSAIFKNNVLVKTAINKKKEVQLNQSIVTDNIKRQIQQTTENYTLALKQNKVYQQAIQQTTENYRIVKDKHNNGLSTTTDLLDADIEQLNAQINYANSKANKLLKYYETQLAAGVLTKSLHL